MVHSPIENEKEMQSWIQNRIDCGVKFIVQKETFNGELRVTRLLDSNGKIMEVNWQNNQNNNQNVN